MEEWCSAWLEEIRQDHELTSKSAQVERLFTLIADNITSTGLTVAVLAEKSGISRRQLYRLTKEWLGIPCGKLITEARLKKARWLLTHQDYSTIKDVIADIGFKSTYYFAKRYEERFGHHPLETPETS